MKIDIKQLKFIDQTLRDILVWAEKATGLEFTITSIYRDGDTGVHGAMPVRGVDLRMRNLSVGREVTSLINREFSYDPSRIGLKCAVLHGADSNLHIHVQVHPNTKRT